MNKHHFHCAPCDDNFALTEPEAGWQGDDPRCPKCQGRDCTFTAYKPGPNADGQKKVGFVVKDSGKREDFSTGARRDTQEGKGDFSRIPYGWLHELAKEMQRRNEPMDRVDLLPVSPLLRLAAVFGRGCDKYDTDIPTPTKPAPTPNYQKGIPLSRCVSSLQRHIIAYAGGDQTEDHLAQAAWNCFAMIFMDEAVRAGKLPVEMGDYGPLVDPNATVTEDIQLVLSSDGKSKVRLPKGHPVFVFHLGEKINHAADCEVVVRRSGAVLRGMVPAGSIAGKVTE